MNGHSGLVPPGPIPNPEVKQADVPGDTVVATGNLVHCSSLIF